MSERGILTFLWGCLTVALRLVVSRAIVVHSIDHRFDVFWVDVRQDAVTQVEDMA